MTCSLLRQPRVTHEEAVEMVAVARRQALEMFPDKAPVFDLVLAPRFQRILDERWPPRPPAPARVLPFRKTQQVAEEEPRQGAIGAPVGDRPSQRLTQVKSRMTPLSSK